MDSSQLEPTHTKFGFHGTHDTSIILFRNMNNDTLPNRLSKYYATVFVYQKNSPHEKVFRKELSSEKQHVDIHIVLRG